MKANRLENVFSIFIVSLLTTCCLILANTIVVHGSLNNQTIQSSTGNETSVNIIVNQSAISQNALGKGVPYTISLSYSNGSFLTTGNLTYTIRFDFGEPFLISELNKGTFDNAVIVANDTVKFSSRPISKGENKTGLVLFLFEDGLLAEKNRTANLDANLTVTSLSAVATDEIPPEGLPLSTNSTGTFANSTSIFTNQTIFESIFGQEPTSLEPQLIRNIPESDLAISLAGLTSSEVAGVINALPESDQEKVLNNLPPLSPSVNATTSFEIGPINSSVVSILTEIVDLIENGSAVIHGVPITWSPCISFDNLEHRKTTERPNIGSLIEFSVVVSNCSNNIELVDLNGKSTNILDHHFSIDKFDMLPKTIKNSTLAIIIPPNTELGFHVFEVTGDVLLNLPFKTVIISQAIGNVFYTILG